MAQKLYEESNIQAIADAIREKNGETTKYKPSEMAAAISAITTGGGSGGGSGNSGGASGIYMAQVTPASDTAELTVTHNLGTTDILAAVCWAETFGDFVPTFDGAVVNVYAKSNVPFRMSSSSNHENFVAYAKWSTSGGNVNAVGQPVSYSYMSEPKDENTFIFESANAASAKYYGGVTYTVIIVAASAFSTTEV